MTRRQWHDLPATQREAVREASAKQSLCGFSRRPRREQDWAKDIWAARDQYRMENFFLGCLMLPVLLILAVIALMLL